MRLSADCVVFFPGLADKSESMMNPDAIMLAAMTMRIRTDLLTANATGTHLPT